MLDDQALFRKAQHSKLDLANATLILREGGAISHVLSHLFLSTIVVIKDLKTAANYPYFYL